MTCDLEKGSRCLGGAINKEDFDLMMGKGGFFWFNPLLGGYILNAGQDLPGKEACMEALYLEWRDNERQREDTLVQGQITWV